MDEVNDRYIREAAEYAHAYHGAIYTKLIVPPFPKELVYAESGIIITEDTNSVEYTESKYQKLKPSYISNKVHIAPNLEIIGWLYYPDKYFCKCCDAFKGVHEHKKGDAIIFLWHPDIY